MVSELLQDRPRLVKQMGSIIFILVYKCISKFPLGYLRYYQRSTHNTHPAKTKFHESFCPRKVLSFLWLSADAARNCGKTFRVQEGWPEAALEALLVWPEAAELWKPLWKPCWCPEQPGCLLCPGGPAELCPMLKELWQQRQHASHRAPVTASSHLPSFSRFCPCN